MSKPIRTDSFNLDVSTHRETPPFEGGSLVGLIVGFSCTFIFFILAARLIILDELLRHSTYDALLIRDVRRLRNDCNKDDEGIDQINREFEEAEIKRNVKVDDVAAAKELAEIN